MLGVFSCENRILCYAQTVTEATTYRTHTCGSLRAEQSGQTVTLAGWVHARRDHGGVRFLDLRDRYGLTQIVLKGVGSRVLGVGADSELHDEDVIRVTGMVQARPEKLKNPKLATGEIEVIAGTIEVLSRSQTPPFEIAGEKPVGEDVRLRYRSLDLRRSRMQRNIQFRDQYITEIRSFLHAEGFLEVETPILTKSTPEGARDYLVPSRLHPGNFYALPQSPQQYKQLLMVAGMDRYFQIARCFRDEDQRGDRQPEFTQLDVEMSFVEREDVLQLMERLFTHVCAQLSVPIARTPFPRLTHAQAIEQYGSDKPDIRTAEEKAGGALAFVWILDFPLFEPHLENGPAAVQALRLPAGKQYAPSHHMFTAPVPEDVPLLDTDPSKVRSTQYDLACNGYEVCGGSIRIHQRHIQEKVFQLVGFELEKARAQFRALLEAFEYGVPPHGGIAHGIDRLLMIMLNEPSLREVMAFPKNQQAQDVLLGAPSPVESEQLRELHLTLKP